MSTPPDGEADPLARARQIFASPPEPPTDIDAARRLLDAEVGPFTERFQDVRENSYIGAAGPEGDDERVTAEVDGSGKVVRVAIGSRAMRDFDAAELSVACTEAVRAARMKLADAMQEVFASMPAFNVPRDASPMAVDDIIRYAKEVSGWQG